MVEVIEMVEIEVKDLDKDIADLEKKLNSMSVTTSVSFQRIVFSACVSSKNKYWLKLFCINGAPEENKSKTTFNKLVIWKGSKMTEETVVEPEKAALTMENGGVVAFLNQKFIHLLFFLCALRG